MTSLGTQSLEPVAASISLPAYVPGPGILRVAPSDADTYFSTLDRVNQGLDHLDRLSAELNPETKRHTKVSMDRAGYSIPPLSFDPPHGFLLSIVIPVYNEMRTIEQVLDRVFALPVAKEVVVVDDCSVDGTAKFLRSMLSRPGLRVIFKERNQGKGAALRDGFAAVKGDIVVVQDADLEYDPRDIPKLLEAILLEGADVAYGSRYLFQSDDLSWFHRLGNGLLTGASNLFTGLDLSDMETCYKAFKRSVIQKIRLKQDRFGFEPEITAKIARRKLKIHEVPIRYQARSYAEGKKIRLKDAVNALYCIARYGVAD